MVLPSQEHLVKLQGKLWNVFSVLHRTPPDTIGFIVCASWDSHFDQSKTIALIPIHHCPRFNSNEDSPGRVHFRVFLARKTFLFSLIKNPRDYIRPRHHPDPLSSDLYIKSEECLVLFNAKINVLKVFHR